MFAKIIDKYIGHGTRGATVKKNAIGAFFIKIFGMGIQLIQVPIVLSYLDKETYGVYLTITSIVMWAHNFDFGLGGGLRYKLTESLSLGDYKRSKELVSTAYISLTAIMAVAACILIPIITALNWNTILNCQNLNNQYLIVCVLTVLVAFLIQFVLDLISIVLQGVQRTAISTIFRPLANSIAVVGVLILSRISHNSLFEACLMLTLPLVIVLLGANIWLFAVKYRKIAPSIKFYNKQLLKDIYSLGIKFFLSSLSGLVIFNTANLLLSYLISPGEVSVYNTCYTYFSLIIVFHGIILTPFWPAITNAYVKGEIAWLENCMGKLAKVTLLFSLGAIALAILSKFAFHIWIGDRLLIPINLVISLCIYAICNIWSATYNCFIVGVGKAQLTMYLSIIKIIIYLPIAIALIKLLGVIGLVISLLIVNTIPNIIFPYIQYQKIIHNKAIGIWNK